MVVPAKGKALVKTDIQIALPDGCYGRVGKILIHIRGALIFVDFVVGLKKSNAIEYVISEGH